ERGGRLVAPVPLAVARPPDARRRRLRAPSDDDGGSRGRI
ncbi:MAG: hypothetical protein AVDCRST_MAG33-3277, partial [uncultured Thermomicrobiales bacterium]